MNSKIKRLSATSLAILSLGSGMGSMLNKNLDFAPKASAAPISKPVITRIPKLEEALEDENFKAEVELIMKGLNKNINNNDYDFVK